MEPFGATRSVGSWKPVRHRDNNGHRKGPSREFSLFSYMAFDCYNYISNAIQEEESFPLILAEMNRIVRSIIAFCLFLAVCPRTYANDDAYFLSDPREVFGEVLRHEISDDGDTLVALAIDRGVGYNAVVDANPGVDPWYPGLGSSVVIPTSWILPEVPAEDRLSEKGYIVINLAEFRLYLVKREGDLLTVLTFPAGIGVAGFETPTGNYRIVKKLRNPSWIIPSSFREEYRHLPDVVPPGPDNPIGQYALSLSIPGFLIHETRSPLAVGRKSSHGCIRLSSVDMRALYPLVYEGFKVIITNQPIKVGMRDDIPYIEVHRPALDSGEEQYPQAVRLLTEKKMIEGINHDALRQALNERLGFPVALR